MKKILEFIIEKITGKKHLKVTETKENDEVSLTVECPKEDIGKVIGKEGRTVKAIKTILRIKANQENTRVNINVKEV